MLFRQLFDQDSCSYTYLLARDYGGEAILIDPVLCKVDQYMKLLKEMRLKLVKVVDTHVHADHITAAPVLRDRTRCITVMGEQSSVDSVSQRISDGEIIAIDGVSLTALYTPGHTDDSYCFLMPDRVFTGDTLLIRGTGRTDFQGGSASEEYDSIISKLLTLPDDTLVFPGHDYKGDTVSTIGEEKQHNPRLQVEGKAAFIAVMENLNLANPKMMDVAIPANQQVAMVQQEIDEQGWSFSAAKLRDLLATDGALLVDLREDAEREKCGYIESSVNIQYNNIDDALAENGVLKVLAKGTQKRLVFYCAYGERSAMALLAARETGIECFHLKGGMAAWSHR
ncbi:MAG: MBL fold metallo-hydrolase [Gammaproteobacteria bacterium]|nr:MBL fold metallo-hydrolase [Gammaproteobacteria bacterium]